MKKKAMGEPLGIKRDGEPLLGGHIALGVHGFHSAASWV
jgi:hypothetical protein